MKRTPRRRIPTTESLVIFDTAARHSNFTRAGAELGLTQSAVSRQILDLEGFLGTALFDRTRRVLTLTDVGRNYWAQIRPLLDALESTALRARPQRTVRDTINLSVSASFCSRWLIPNLPAFLAAHPDTRINVSPRVGPVDLEAGNFDAAVINVAAPPPGVAAQQLFPIRLAAYAAPRLLAQAPPLKAAEIARLPLLHLQEERRAWAAYFAAMGSPALAVPDGPCYSLLLLTCEAALAGLGAALLPPQFVADSVEAGRLARLAPTEIEDTPAYYLIWRRVNDLHPGLLALREWLAATLPTTVADVRT